MYNKKKEFSSEIHSALDFCKYKGFYPNSLELENIETGNIEVFGIDDHKFPNANELLHSAIILSISLLKTINGFVIKL